MPDIIRLIVSEVLRIHPIMDTGFHLHTDVGSVYNLYSNDIDDRFAIPNINGFKYIAGCILNDAIALEGTITANSLLQVLLEEGVFFTTAPAETGSGFTTFVFNPPLNAVTEYTNYNFNSFAKLGEQYYGASEKGLYLLEGVLDDEDCIQVKIQTAAMDFGTSNLKQVSQMYLGVDQDGDIIMKVMIDGNAQSLYRLPVASNHLSTQRIKLSKGLVGRYFQFELITQDNTVFNLDSIEFYPMPFGRKI
jgi:hypothetical protein